jgi:hypothetical protein
LENFRQKRMGPLDKCHIELGNGHSIQLYYCTRKESQKGHVLGSQILGPANLVVEKTFQLQLLLYKNLSNAWD